MIDAPGQPFHDPEADAALFDAHRDDARPDRTAPASSRLPLHINDPDFADGARRQPSATSPCQLRSRHMPAHSRARTILERFHDMVAPRRADHRRRRRHRPLGQVRGGRRHRPHRHLQFRPLPHGRARLDGRPAGLRQRQRDRQGDGARGAARRAKHTPVLAGVNGTDPFCCSIRFLAELKALGFSGMQNFPTVGLFDGALPRRASRRPAWATGSRST